MEIPRNCPSCGLVLLYGAIFDACAERERFGPILGLHKDANPLDAKAGYIGISSLWLYDQAPDLYRCARCKTLPVDTSKPASSPCQAPPGHWSDGPDDTVVE